MISYAGWLVLIILALFGLVTLLVVLGWILYLILVGKKPE